MEKRSQIKLGETLAILVIFFFLLVFGFAFYYRIMLINSNKDTSENMDLKSIQISQKVSFMTELSCTSKNVQVENCFDKLKLNAFGKLINRSESPPGDFFKFYFDMFGYSEIKVKELYPATQKYYSIYYNPMYTDAIKGRSIYNLTSEIPISIYDPVNNKYSFGVLEINVYG